MWFLDLCQLLNYYVAQGTADADAGPFDITEGGIPEISGEDQEGYDQCA